MSPSANQPVVKDSLMSKLKARLTMESIIEFVFRTCLAALALLASMVKTIFRKWSAVDQTSAIVCVAMFIISLLTWNSYLLLCWIGAAACLSIAATNGWQWSLVEDLIRFRQNGFAQMFKSSSIRVDVVGQHVDLAASTARRQTTDA